MLGSAAVSEVQQILGWRTDKATQILAALQYAQTEREKPGLTFPWWLWKEDQSLPALTINSQTLALPSDFIQDSEEKDGNIRYVPTTANARTFFLKKMDFEIAEKNFFGDWSSFWDVAIEAVNPLSPGTPKAYVLRQSSIRIYPKPDAAYVLTWSYWGKADTITLNTENAWLANAPWVLIADASKKLGADLQNGAAVATAQQIGQMAEQNMFRSTIARRESGRSRRMGSRL
jgi:hypothetical protein